MKTHPFIDDEKESFVLSLTRHVGSVHDNVAFAESIPSELSLPTPAEPFESPSLVISFEEINYHVGRARRRTRPPCCNADDHKQILHDITGGFAPGMNAILGPSGCGKSSLLDILADRKDQSGLSGRVLVFGRPRSKTFKYSIGYVVQEDVISGILTVRENLMFSANVRLQGSRTPQQRLELVNKIIGDLGLERCADSLIGTHFLRGVSGGEKRRACIGMELVLSPSILFLDEPTSGLDASTAETVMKCLHKLSREGCTIIFSIHQPRYSIYKLFDTVLLLSAGHTVYLNSADGLLPYFASHGFKCEEHDNPADFALDVIIHCNSRSSTVLYSAYRRSAMHLHWEECMSNKSLANERYADTSMARSRLDEFYYVCGRTFRNTIRDPAMAASQIIVATLLALLTGLVFNHMQATVDTGVQNRLGAIFFIVVNQIYSTATALEPLVQERALFIHENASGYYRVSTFFFAKLICDLLPMRLIPSVIYSMITYSMTGFQLTIDRFLVYLLTIFMSTVFGSSICFFVASFIPMFAVSLIVVVFIFVLMMVFSGFLIDLQSIFASLRWMQWFSAFRYATNLLTINEFRNLTFCATNSTQYCLLKGEEVLEQRGIPYEHAWDIWKNLVALALMIVSFLSLSFVQLIRMKKVK